MNDAAAAFNLKPTFIKDVERGKCVDLWISSLYELAESAIFKFTELSTKQSIVSNRKTFVLFDLV